LAIVREMKLNPAFQHDFDSAKAEIAGAKRHQEAAIPASVGR